MVVVNAGTVSIFGGIFPTKEQKKLMANSAPTILQGKFSFKPFAGKNETKSFLLNAEIM
jgi:hypothetical protein